MADPISTETTETTGEQITETTTTTAQNTTAGQTITAAAPTADTTELNKLKAALDKATKEASEYKKQLRASQSAEERRAEEERERQEAIEEELKTLRKQAAVSSIAKKVMTFTGDETVSNAVAESMYGAEDVDAVIDAINKAWTAREKKLRMEFGKIPSPGVGADDGPTITREQLSAMSYLERLDFATKHPEAYNKLTSR